MLSLDAAFAPFIIVTARECGNLIMLRKKMRLLHHFVLRKNIFKVASATPKLLGA
jgi:hypothetical protein